MSDSLVPSAVRSRPCLGMVIVAVIYSLPSLPVRVGLPDDTLPPQSPRTLSSVHTITRVETRLIATSGDQR